MADEIFIDNNILIEEIEPRPILYDKSLKDYSNLIIKKSLWEEVCTKVFFKIWSKLTSEEKEKAVSEAQKRWKNLRSGFARELRAQKETSSGQSAKKRRKYVYFEQLLFLLPTLDQRETTSNTSTMEQNEDSLQEESTQEGNIQEGQTQEGTQAEVITLRTNKNNKQPKKKTYEESLIEILKAKKDEKCSNNHETDQDTSFVLSLVPMLRSLPVPEKLQLQIRILQLFQQVTTKPGPNTYFAYPSPTQFPQSQHAGYPYQQTAPQETITKASSIRILNCKRLARTSPSRTTTLTQNIYPSTSTYHSPSPVVYPSTSTYHSPYPVVYPSTSTYHSPSPVVNPSTSTYHSPSPVANSPTSTYNSPSPMDNYEVTSPNSPPVETISSFVSTYTPEPDESVLFYSDTKDK